MQQLNLLPLALTLLASPLCGNAQHEVSVGSNPRWTTPKEFKSLAPHPRLFASTAQIERMVAGRGEAYEETYEKVAAAAEHGLLDTADPMHYISSFSRGFQIQGRLTSLAIEWHRTKDRRYLAAAVETVENMESWLSSIKSYSLQHGQYVAAVAVAYDLLYNDLTPAERRRMVGFARKNCVRPFLRFTGRGHSGFRSPGFRDTLLFGVYFNPHAEPCGFGDNRHGNISSSLLAAAHRYALADRRPGSRCNPGLDVDPGRRCR